MPNAAVIGQPISHSRSPRIFSALAEQEGLASLRYRAIEVSPEGLPDFIRECAKEPDFVGCNVTVPLKEIALREALNASDEARAVGAANILHFTPGDIRAHNTDVIGFSRALKETGSEIAGRDFALLGAGGAARAAAFALGDGGAARVSVINRDPLRAQKLCRELGAQFPKTCFEMSTPSSRHFAGVIHATSIGVAEQADPEFFACLCGLRFAPNAVAFDLNYQPAWSAFLQAGLSLGLQTHGGLSMLIHQALATWEIWFGPLKDAAGARTRLEALLRSELPAGANARPIFLMGFMGAGKSEVARALASELGWEALDCDAEVERLAGRKIQEIFSTEGEAAFRARESEAIARLAMRPRAVIALGGGAVLNPSNLELILRAGRAVYLEASPATLLSRLSKDPAPRPLLSGLNERARIDKLHRMLTEREPLYLKAPHRCSTDHRSPVEIARELRNTLFKESS